ncbi:MAG: late competence development ComFB family protein [Oscillospiraceae bacterium]|nr:late competence development ComFB family protein [Oscillospiraceae bacterium]
MKNVMEDVVRERLDALLRGMDCCKCEKCVNDMTARSLNSLAPKYSNSETGELYSRAGILNQQNLIDIDVQIAKSISIVTEKPHKS